MITFLSKRIRALMVLAFLLSGFITSFWSKPSFSQTVFSQQQAGSVLGIEKVAVQLGRLSLEKFAIIEEHRP